MLSKNQKIGGARYIGLCLAVIATLGLVLTLETGIAKAVTPSTSNNWADFSGTTLHNINANYASVIYDTDNNGLCETSDLTGATQVAVSPKASWLAGSYFLNGASLSLGFNMPDPDYRDRGLCLRYNSSGNYFIEPTNAFFYNAGATPTPTPSGDILTASSSISVFSTATAGDMILAIMLFALIMLTLFQIFLRKI
jgi:hypothetical protein